MLSQKLQQKVQLLQRNMSYYLRHKKPPKWANWHLTNNYFCIINHAIKSSIINALLTPFPGKSAGTEYGLSKVDASVHHQASCHMNQNSML